MGTIDLKQVARDAVEGQIFTSIGVEPEKLHSIFMPLVFMSVEQKQELIDRKVFMLYAYLKDAAPIAVNGDPVFMSMHTLDQGQYEEFKFYVEEYIKLTEGYNGISFTKPVSDTGSGEPSKAESTEGLGTNGTSSKTKPRSRKPSTKVKRESSGKTSRSKS